MFNKNYVNFVRPTSDVTSACTKNRKPPLTGDEAREIYLNEVKHVRHDSKIISDNKKDSRQRVLRSNSVNLSDKDLFLSVQNNDVDTLKLALNACPGNVNKFDEFGWSLLMIACQANSVESVKELLKRGVDTSVRDRGGNSAYSLLIKNKNYQLADLILSQKSNHEEIKIRSKNKSDKKDETKPFLCDLCNIEVSNKDYHLSSTIHNINLSKGKKLPTNYVIPESNRGYQIMLKVGWDKESGLGPDGSGKKYPIKTVQKQDRKGLGHVKRKMPESKEAEAVKNKYRKRMSGNYESNRKMEINFRREFY